MEAEELEPATVCRFSRSLSLNSLPLLVAPSGGARSDDLVELLAAEGASLRRGLERAGAMLFRGYSVTEPADLARVIEAAGVRTQRYVGGDSPRTSLERDVYTSTEAPAAIALPLHNEMSYLASPPAYVWMACSTAASELGATTIADGRAVLRALDPRLRDRFREHGVRYRCAFRGPGGVLGVLDELFHASKSWMSAFETDDPRVAEERCRATGSQPSWTASGHLVAESVLPATRLHPQTGEAAWFNQAHMFLLSPRYLGRMRFEAARALFRDPETRPHHATYGDGSAIDAETIEHIFDVLDAHTVPVRWRTGDVLWIDNSICMHGRERFRGPRRILVSVGD